MLQSKAGKVLSGCGVMLALKIWDLKDFVGFKAARPCNTGTVQHVITTGWNAHPRVKKIRMKWISRSAWRKKYQRYIASRAWRRFRERVFEAQGRYCKACGKGPDEGKKLQVHHLNYKRLFHEHLADVQVLCWQCHRKEHPGKKLNWKKRTPKS